MKSNKFLSAIILLMWIALFPIKQMQANNTPSSLTGAPANISCVDEALVASTWDCRYVTYNLLNGTLDIPGDGELFEIRNAFAKWSAVTSIDFIQVDDLDADIMMKWEPFPGPSFLDLYNNVFASFALGYPPPPCFDSELCGYFFFNDFHNWTVSGASPRVVVHTLDALSTTLGLSSFNGSNGTLSPEDIDNVQALYGPRTSPILGAQKLCFQDQYQLEDFECLPEGISITWSVSNNLSVGPGQGTEEITIIPLAESGIGYITVTLDSGLEQIQFTKAISLIDCQECCPAGASFDGANCSFGEGVPQGYEGFIWENRFYVKPDCKIDPDNHCCPLGYTFDGYNCFSGIRYIDWYEGFIEDDKYYTKPNCRLNCCPSGFNYDGANCHSGVNYTDVNAFIYENNFYTSPNCEAYPGTCCPPGSGFDGFNCHFGPVPFGYKGFIYNNGFYVTPNCEICCPEGASYDGANCHYGIDIPEGHEGFVFNNNFYVKPNCKLNPGSCCPPGTSFDGVNCHYNNINIPDVYEAFIWNNSLYTKAIDCYEGGGKSNGKSRSGDLENWSTNFAEKVDVYPNPTSGAFTVNLASILDELQQVDLIGVNGQVLLTFSKDQLVPTLLIDEELDNGVYFVRVQTHRGTETIKVVKMN